MFKKILILITLMQLCANVQAKELQIIASNTPIASFVAMIGSDKVKITTIAARGACPHHYFIKPSQLAHFKNADLIVYINSDFERFMSAPLAATKASILQLSSAVTLNDSGNWHVWLNFQNVRNVLGVISSQLCAMDPANKDVYQQNYIHSMTKIAALQDKMLSGLGSLKKVIVLDDSLSYLFSNFLPQDQLMQVKSHHGVIGAKSLQKAQKDLLRTRSRCIFSSKHQDTVKLQNFFGSKVKVVSVDVDLADQEGELSTLFENSIENIIQDITNCV
jgi:zinc transport system substrate-binding protein